MPTTWRHLHAPVADPGKPGPHPATRISRESAEYQALWDSDQRHALAPAGSDQLARLPAYPEAIDPDPVRWAQSHLGFHPDPVQAEILRSPAARLMLCCTRQFGKSTITAIKALHYAWTHPGSLVLAAAPTARQSGEWLEKTRCFLNVLGVRSRSDGHNRLSLVLSNGSRLIGLPGMPDNVRGFSKAGLIIIDEAGFVPDELYQALNPMLAVSRGGLWLISTPAAQLGFFYDEWSRDELWAPLPAPPANPIPENYADRLPTPAEPSLHKSPCGHQPPSGSVAHPSAARFPWPVAAPGSASSCRNQLPLPNSDRSATRRPTPTEPSLLEWPGSEHSPPGTPRLAAQHGELQGPPKDGVAWHRFRVTAEQCPRISPDFLAEQRILLGDSVFRREYMCEFVAAGTQIIDRDLLDSALDPGLSPFNNGAPIWRK